MTASVIRQLGRILPYALLALSAAACTDGRIQRGSIALNPQQSINSGGLVLANQFQFNNQSTNAVQMVMSGTSLFMSGYSFGVLRAEIGANPEAPTLSFAEADNIVYFSPIGQFKPDDEASGALAIDGNLLITSGQKATSLINITSTNLPQELARFPGLAADGSGQTSDPNGHFAYRAIIANGNVFYGFRQQDYVDTVGIANSGLTVARSDRYSSGGNVCCVTSGTLFQGTVMIGFTNAIAMFQIASNGQLTNPSIFNGLQATYITSTQNYLYVQHTPTYGNTATSQYPRGIYVFDTQGNQVSFFSSNQFVNFAVSPDDSHLYGNLDGTQVGIYRIQR